MKQAQGKGQAGNSDWVCLNCSNLNYSFRKICNRCRSITRQQNHQNYLHMQYMHIYYQQPFLNAQDPPTSSQLHQNTPNNAPEPARIEEVKELPRKQSASSEHSDFTEVRSADWGSCEAESRFMFLLENAWEGLYNKSDVSEFKTCEEIENTREEDDVEQSEDILTNFDFTFI